MSNNNPTNQNEIWKPIPGFPGYEASSLGQIKSYRRCKKGRILKPRVNSRGYLQIIIQCDLEDITRLIHTLIALTFIGPRPTVRHTIDHKDGNKLNNLPDNLEYVPHSENLKRAFKLGLRNSKGEKHSQAKLTEATVLEIRKEFDRQPYYLGLIRDMAIKYKIHQGTMKDIIRRKRWKHI